MQTLTNSRIITHPDLLEKTTNHTVIIVDPTEEELEVVGLFCMSSNRNYDIYVYSGALGALEWLHEVNNRADAMLINHNSQVSSNVGERYNDNELIEYFQKVDQEGQKE